jgi:hypothetical protein
MMTSLLLLACAGNTVPAGADDDSSAPESQAPVLGEEVYDITRVMEVEIELDPEEWETIRQQKRNLIGELASDSCMEQPFDSPYTWIAGTVTIDGETLDDVAVRKKGLLGSVTADRPSLKLRFDKYEEDQLFHGLSRLTFNNGRQDNSRIKSCMGYGVYQDLGVAASRCSFAHVTVNGEELGVYSNVEPVKAPMLARVYGDGGGDLYEGTLSDFRTGWMGTFQDKEDSGDFSEIQAVTDVLESDPDDLIGALEVHMDVAQFIAAWSADALIGHWDSYPGNTNNFYVYVHPEDGRLRFIPWGIDAVLTGSSPFGAGLPTAVVARSALPQALYADPEGRRLYWEQMERHLDRWDGQVLSERVSEAKELVKPWLWEDLDRSAFRAEVAAVDDFVTARETLVLAELLADPDVDLTQRPWPCLGPVGSADIRFETTWGSYGREPTWSTGTGEMSVVFDGVDAQVSFLSAVFGEYDEGLSVGLVVGQTPEGANLAWYGLGPTEAFTRTGTVEADWDRLTAYLLYDADGDFQNFQTAAYVGGPLHIDQGGEEVGDALSGSMEMIVYGATEAR